jgi:hypothetical protein
LGSSKYGTILPDFLGEAKRIVDVANKENVPLRLLGAVAFNLHCPKFSFMQQKLGRSFSDLDFASYRKRASQVSKLFAELGYVEDIKVTTLYGSNRLVFHDPTGNNRHCDVFLDKLQFSHDISFQDRLETDSLTVPLAELLLEKMQIVKLDKKDVIDTIMLLREHSIGDSDDETINAGRIARLCSQDWGLWKTITTNLKRTEQAAQEMDPLTEEDVADVSAKIKVLLGRIQNEPKSTGWRMRAKVGERRKWYREVEELSRF